MTAREALKNLLMELDMLPESAWQDSDFLLRLCYRIEYLRDAYRDGKAVTAVPLDAIRRGAA